MARSEFLQQSTNARNVGTPLCSINTQDAIETMLNITEALVGDWQEKAKQDPRAPQPLFMKWDIIAGLTGITDASVKAVLNMFPTIEVPPGKPRTMEYLAAGIQKFTSNPIDMCKVAPRVPEQTVLFFLNAHRLLDDLGGGISLSFAQGIGNLREIFKDGSRMAVLLGPQIKLPMQLQHDVLPLDEPLPDAAARGKLLAEGMAIFNEGQKAAKRPVLDLPDAATSDRVVGITSALSAFAVDQSLAMNMIADGKRIGFNINGLTKRKIQFLESTPGVRVCNGNEVFQDLKGQDNIQQFGLDLLNGEDPFRLVAIFDEAEKTAGAGSGDTSQVSQELHGALLTFMQEKDIPGIIELGPGGSGKTVFAKALGNMAPGGKILTLFVSVAEMKSSFVGSSMANFMQFARIVEAASDGRPLFIFTANRFDFTPEFQRRCYLGKWFFDLPGKAELDDIWKVYIDKYALDPKQALPECTGWTGAEVRACALLGRKLRRPLIDCASLIVPIAVSARDQINALRLEADSKFISAAYPGPYQYKEIIAELKGTRKIVVDNPSRTRPLNN